MRVLEGFILIQGFVIGKVSGVVDTMRVSVYMAYRARTGLARGQVNSKVAPSPHATLKRQTQTFKA